MDTIRETIYLEDNPTSGYWEIPFYAIGLQDDDTSTDVYIEVELLSDKYRTAASSSYSIYVSGDNSSSSSRRITVVPDSVADCWYVQIPSSNTFVNNEASGFNQYMTLKVNVLTVSADDLKMRFIYTLRKAPVSSGGSSAAAVAVAVWNYSDPTPASGTLGTRTLSSTVEVDPDDIAEAVWNYGAEEGDETLTDRTLSTTVEVNPSAIAQAVWNYADANPASGTLGTRTLTTAIPTAANIATAVLTTDVSDESVETDEYTLKHLVMASQRSKVVTENGETVWKIMGNRLSGETGEEIVIATRTLTLNANGAITQTM